jgi:hypothetical protein
MAENAIKVALYLGYTTDILLARMSIRIKPVSIRMYPVDGKKSPIAISKKPKVPNILIIFSNLYSF